jgi:hypothetical protein
VAGWGQLVMQGLAADAGRARVLGQLAALMRGWDADGDGHINYREFVAMAGAAQDRSAYDAYSSLGGATQGFRDLSQYEARVLKRARLARAAGAEGWEDVTPRGLQARPAPPLTQSPPLPHAPPATSPNV